MNTYFNMAGRAPALPEAQAAFAAADKIDQKLVFGPAGVDHYKEVLQSARHTMASLINAGSEESVAYISNACTAVEFPFLALKVVPGTTVITSDQEHPGIEEQLARLAAQGMKIERIGGDTSAEIIQKTLNVCEHEDVSTMVMSQVSYKDGRVLPVNALGAIARDIGAAFIVDGTQAIGQMPVDVVQMNADAFCFSGHKWLGGPTMSGGLYLSPRFSNFSRFPIDHAGNKGTLNVGMVAGLDAVMKLHLRDGAQKIARLKACKQLVETLLPLSDVFRRSAWRGRFAPGIAARIVPDRYPTEDMTRWIAHHHGLSVKGFKPPELPNAIRVSYGADYTADDFAQIPPVFQAIESAIAENPAWKPMVPK